MANVTTGVDMGHYAILTTDPTNPPGTPTPQSPVYGDVVSLPGLREVGVNSSDAFATVFGDNAPQLTTASKSEKTVNFTRLSITSEEKVALLNWKKTADGKYFETADSIPPYIAIGFRIEMSDKSYVYYWMLKGRAAINQITAQTREATVNPQFAPATGTFVARTCDNAFLVSKTGDDTLAATWFTKDTLQALLVGNAVGTSGASVQMTTSYTDNKTLKADKE
jgi:phi13 family phage major tail protein